MNINKLFHRSSFFIDAMNVLLYSDLFIYHEMKYRMENEEHGEYCLQDLFGESFPKFKSDSKVLEDRMVINECSKKNNQNILLDWIDGRAFDSEESLSRYLSMLYFDVFEQPRCDEFIQMTEFGNTMKLLMMDTNLTKIVIYLPFKTDFLISNIEELFSGTSKVEIVIGPKSEILKSISHDSYVFENVLDVDRYLVGKASKLTEILIPTYEYNMTDGRTDIDKILEQVTYRKLNLSHNPSDYMKEYNLSVNTISVPI